MKRTMLVSLLAIFFFQNLNAQCDVTKDEKHSDQISFASKTEQLYKNKDLENGVKIIYSNCILLVQKTNKNNWKFYIVVSYIKSRYQPAIVPRKIIFQFSNAEQLSFAAERSDNPTLSNGIRSESCYFRINLTDMDIIKDNPLSSLTIIDNRTNESIKISPYSAIFQEQIKCLLSSQDE